MDANPCSTMPTARGSDAGAQAPCATLGSCCTTPPGPMGLGAFGSTTAGPWLGAPSLGSIFSPWHPSALVPAALLPPAGISKLRGFAGRSLLLFVVARYFFLYFGWDDIPGTGASIFNHKEKLITVLHVLPQECSPLNNSGLLCHRRYNNRCAIKSFFPSFPENKRPPGSVCLSLLPLCSPQSRGRLPCARGGAGGAFPKSLLGHLVPSVGSHRLRALFAGCCFK